MKDPTCEEYPKPVPGVKSNPCGKPACHFYVMWLKNDAAGTRIFTARCEDHPREKDVGKLFEATPITREDYLVSEVMES